MSVELDPLRDQIAGGMRLARAAVDHVTAALCDSDHPARDSLQDTDNALRLLRCELEDQALAIRATGAGAAMTDLPAIVTAAHVNADVECIADLVRRLADIAWSRPSRPPIPDELRAIVCQMGQVCVEATAAAGEALDAADSDATAETGTTNGEMRQLQQLFYARLLADPGAVDVDAALDAALASRLYVRCAELAVSVAQHASLLARGRFG